MINITSRQYIDHLGRTISGGIPIGNQGDNGTYSVSFRLFFGVYVSNNVPVEVVGGGTLTLVLSGVDGGWANIGIASGDTVIINLKNYDGTMTVTGSLSATIVNGDELVFNTPFPVFMQASEGYVYVNKTPQAIDTWFNLIPRDQPEGLESLIDNTTVRIQNQNISGLGVGSSATLTQIGNLSGGILGSCGITRNANTIDPVSMGIATNYTITINFKWWLYLSRFEQDYFHDILTVTPFIYTSFYPLFNNFGTALSQGFKPTTDGNSGFRDENFNQNPHPFTITSFVWRDSNSNAISAFDYSQQTEFEITIDSTAGFGTNFGLIFFNDIEDQDLYSSTSDNDNGDYNHGRHTILAEIATLTQSTGQSFTSFIGKNGEQLSFYDIDISVSGVTATIKGKILPNTQFTDKFLPDDFLEKNFVFLVRSEGSTFTASNYSNTVNLTAWKGTGEVAPVILGEYTPLSVMYDHNGGEFITPGFNPPSINDPVVIEDNVNAEYLLEFDRFRLHKKITFFNCAVNKITGEVYMLETYEIPLTQTILNDGTQPINVSVGTYFKNTFPVSMQNLTQNYASLNIEIYRNYAFDSINRYGILMRFPFLIRWEYWLNQLNVPIDFYSTDNKNWLNYQTSDWDLGLGYDLEVNEGSYRTINILEWNNLAGYERVKNYNNDLNVDCSISFERMDGTSVTNPLIGEITKVKVLWTGLSFLFAFDWATMFVEPFESQQAYLISSIYPQGSNPLNPLIPLNGSGDLLLVTQISPTSYLMECLFDPNRINVTNGVSFSPRIDGRSNLVSILSEREKFHFKLVQLPVITGTQGKDGRCCECLPELKLADVDSPELIKNDITGIAHKLNDPVETVTFKIFKDGILIPNQGVDMNFQGAFPNDDLARGFVYNWRQYLISHGEGCYEIKKEINPAGITFELSVGKYELRQYTTDTAERTARVLAQFNMVSQFEQDGVTTLINFADSGFEDSFRARAMFGWWQPNVEVINHVSDTRVNRTARVNSKETYLFRLFDATQCSVERLHYMTIHASVWRMSDHNWSNPNQKLIITECILDVDATEEIEYFPGSRKMKSEIVLRKRTTNSVSRFDGSIEMPKGVSFVLASIGAEEVGGSCLPAIITINNTVGTQVGSETIPSGQSGISIAPDGSVNITNDTLPTWTHVQNVVSGGNQTYVLPGQIIIVKDSNTGNIIATISHIYEPSFDLMVNFLTPTIGLSAMPLRTGQTISYNSDDDGDTQRGRHFFELPIINLIQQVNYFGNKWRFTGITGSYHDRSDDTYRYSNGTLINIGTVMDNANEAFPEGIVLDHLTLDQMGNILTYYRRLVQVGGIFDFNWSDSVNNAASFGTTTFPTGWYMPNKKEIENISWDGGSGLGTMFAYSPFSNESGAQYVGQGLWSATTLPGSSGNALQIPSYQYGFFVFESKTNTYRTTAVRITNISEL